MILGARSVTRPDGRVGASGRVGAITAVSAGLVAVINGGLVLAVATGSPGSGTGVAGGASGFVMGFIAVVLGGLALARSRRQEHAP